MTDTTTTTTTAAPTTAAADSSASSASTTQNSQVAPGQAGGSTEPSSSTPSPDQAAAQPTGADEKNSGKTDDSAQDQQAKPDADKPQTGDQPSDDEKPDDAKKDDEGKDKEEGNQEAQPQQYESFALPEGIEMDNDALNEALPVLQGLKASQEDAQKLVNIGANMISKVMKNVSEQHNKVVEGWRKESESLFGKDGDAKFQERVGRAEEVVKQFFKTEEQRNILTAYGLGNHPAFFAMCLAIAEGTSEDRPTLPASTGGFQSTQTLAQTWYPDNS